MAYFIWKNTDSRDVKGLIVVELPAIRKPKMRTQILTLDGRDGSIINKLGFEAYKKTIKIGLTRDYNIDNIIEWLSGESTLTLSNEPDKYYNAQILDGVDFEKLLRFKTADITLDVQPFKYSTIERKRIFDTTEISNIKIANTGNYTAKPLMKINGSGTIQIYADATPVFSLDLEQNDSVILDSAEQEAYDINGLRNRIMTGNFLELQKGITTLTWTGNITQIEIEKFSRWI